MSRQTLSGLVYLPVIRSSVLRARKLRARRAIHSNAEHGGPAVSGFFPSGFHRIFATKPVRSETHKQNSCHWQPWFYSGLVAHSYFGLSEGPIVKLETRCTRHAEPNILLETHPRTPVSQNRTRHCRERSPGRERNQVRDTKLFVTSDIWRRTRLLSSKQSR